VDDTRRAPIDRRTIALFAVPMAILTIAGWIGDAFAPTLLTEAPLVLLLCNPRLRNLMLVSPTVDVVPFVIVAVGRLILSDPLFFLFGRRYGDVAIRWMEKRLGPNAGMVLWAERLFRKAALPVVAVIPNNMICLLAGATGMRWSVFAALNVSGTVVRVAGVRVLGDAFAEPILSFNDWVADNRLVLTACTFGIVFAIAMRNAWRGRDELETPEELAEELTETLSETLSDDLSSVRETAAPEGRPNAGSAPAPDEV
jgi:membrane protein DedA with SNARE-associated domain